jgi:hypothetical protein
MFISCARRVLYGSCSYVAVPTDDLHHWHNKFGLLETKEQTKELSSYTLVKVAGLRALEWDDLKSYKVVESSTPLATGPRDANEHLTSNRMVWALFSGSGMVFKSVKEQGRVHTVLSWYGHGGYDPEAPDISPYERSLVCYDPQFPDIELL